MNKQNQKQTISNPLPLYYELYFVKKRVYRSEANRSLTFVELLECIVQSLIITLSFFTVLVAFSVFYKTNLFTHLLLLARNVLNHF